MKKKNPIPFYVIVDDVNKKEFIKYDVMKYFISCYDEAKKKDRPTTFKEFKEFVERNGKYMYWSRCEYEIILHPWVSKTTETKIDVWWQIEMNIDLVARLLMYNLGINEF